MGRLGALTPGALDVDGTLEVNAALVKEGRLPAGVFEALTAALQDPYASPTIDQPELGDTLFEAAFPFSAMPLTLEAAYRAGYEVIERMLDALWKTPGMPKADLNNGSLERFLRGLLDNAVEALVTVFGKTLTGAQVVVRAQVKTGRLWLQIEDNGPGIPAERMRDLGRKYVKSQKTPSPYHLAGSLGNGAFLANVRSLALSYGWELVFENAPNGQRGATVSLVIPMPAPSPAPKVRTLTTETSA
jgi:signal transduction histidine kinase